MDHSKIIDTSETYQGPGRRRQRGAMVFNAISGGPAADLTLAERNAGRVEQEMAARVFRDGPMCRFVPPMRAVDRPIERMAKMPAAQTLARDGPLGRNKRRQLLRALALLAVGRGSCTAHFFFFLLVLSILDFRLTFEQSTTSTRYIYIYMSKLVATSKGKLRSNQQDDAEIYPEVHFTMEASPRWSGAVFTKVKHQIALIWHTVSPSCLTIDVARHVSLCCR